MNRSKYLVPILMIGLGVGCAHRDKTAAEPGARHAETHAETAVSGTTLEAPGQSYVSKPEIARPRSMGATIIDSETTMPSIGSMIWNTYSHPVVLLLFAAGFGTAIGLLARLYRVHIYNRAQ